MKTAQAGTAEWLQASANIISLEAYTDVSAAESIHVRIYPFVEAERPVGAVASKWLRRLDDLASLERDWDSYGSEPPSETALEIARSIIRDVADRIPEDRGLPFFIAPLSGAGVQIEWKGESDSIEVEVAADGALCCLITKGSGPERTLEEHDDVRHAELIELICSVVELLPKVVDRDGMKKAAYPSA